MRKTFLAAVALIALSAPSFGWGGIGHQTTVVVAERHLTETAKANLASLFGYPLRNDASWMDTHRRDPEYAFTGSYHTMAMNHDFIFDPSWRIATGGDCVTGLEFVDYMLMHAGELNLSKDAYLLYARMVFHIVGDMHCLSHSYVMPEKNQWQCTYAGKDYRYHGFLDHITDIMFEGMSIDEVAAKVDICTDEEIRAWQRGNFYKWAQNCCFRDKAALDVNPYGTKNLDPDTVEKLRPAVEEALRVGGYRLALLLNRYFGAPNMTWNDVTAEIIGSVYDKNGDKGVIWQADASTHTATIVSAWVSPKQVAWSTAEFAELGGKSHANNGGYNNAVEIAASKYYNNSGEKVSWAFDECRKAENGFGEGWYLPARYELNNLFDAYYGVPEGTMLKSGTRKEDISGMVSQETKERFDASMKELGGEPLDQAGEKTGLWSSTLCNNGVEAWITRFSPLAYTTHKTVLDNRYYVRCMKKVTLF